MGQLTAAEKINEVICVRSLGFAAKLRTPSPIEISSISSGPGTRLRFLHPSVLHFVVACRLPCLQTIVRICSQSHKPFVEIFDTYRSHWRIRARAPIRRLRALSPTLGQAFTSRPHSVALSSNNPRAILRAPIASVQSTRDYLFLPRPLRARFFGLR